MQINVVHVIIIRNLGPYTKLGVRKKISINQPNVKITLKTNINITYPIKKKYSPVPISILRISTDRNWKLNITARIDMML